MSIEKICKCKKPPLRATIWKTYEVGHPIKNSQIIGRDKYCEICKKKKQIAHNNNISSLKANNINQAPVPVERSE